MWSLRTWKQTPFQAAVSVEFSGGCTSTTTWIGDQVERKCAGGAVIRAFLIMQKVLGFVCNVLQKSAQAYSILTEYEYEITGGRKGNTVTVIVSFPQDAYHHLAGFQYARLEKLKEQKSALRHVLDGQVTFDTLQQSGFKHWDRIQGIIKLKECLEQNRFVFYYRTHENPYSRIKADFLFSLEDMLFFTAEGKPVSLFCCSDKINYLRKCPKYTILRIDRICISTSEKITVYKRD